MAINTMPTPTTPADVPKSRADAEKLVIEQRAKIEEFRNTLASKSDQTKDAVKTLQERIDKSLSVLESHLSSNTDEAAFDQIALESYFEYTKNAKETMLALEKIVNLLENVKTGDDIKAELENLKTTVMNLEKERDELKKKLDEKETGVDKDVPEKKR